MIMASNFRSRPVESEWEKERIFLEELTTVSSKFVFVNASLGTVGGQNFQWSERFRVE